jgi:hypothetical protein
VGDDVSSQCFAPYAMFETAVSRRTN